MLFCSFFEVYSNNILLIFFLFPRDGTLDIALECVENILIECNDQNPHVGDLLSKSVSIDKLRNGFDYMCNNIDSKCWKSLHSM